jgi:hypothetical protein
MLNSSLTRSVSPLAVSRDVAPPLHTDHAAASIAHVFATPVVREVRRPVSEPASFATTW